MESIKGKRVLITGASGLIGKHLTQKLLDLGAKVIAIGRNKKKLENVFNKLMGNPDFTCLKSNIVEGFPAIENIDYVFHAASPISGTEIRTMPVDTIATNIDGTRNCLEFLKNQGHGRLIVFSSATTYGNFNLIEDITVTEDMTDKADALNTPNVPYSESKRMIEVMAHAYRIQYAVDSVIVRIGYVYGYTNPHPNTAFYEFIDKAIKGENIVLNNSGMGRRDNIYVDDVVSGLLIVALNGTTGETYNISSNGEMDNFQAIDEIAELIASSVNEIGAKKVKVLIKPMDEPRKPGMKMDNSKLQLLGWCVKHSLSEGIKKTVKQYYEVGTNVSE